MAMNSRRNGMRRILLLLPLLLLLPAALLWLFAAPLAGWVAGKYLDTLDFELRRLDQLELRLDGLDLAGLALAGEQLSLQASGISADFAWPRIAGIEIAELRLHVPAREAGGGGPAPDIAAMLRTLRELPIGGLEIAALRLVAGETEFRGRLRAFTAPLRVEWDIESPWPLALRLTSAEPDHISGAVAMAAPQGLRGEFEGKVTGEVIEGALEAALTPREIAELFGVEANLPAGSLEVAGPFALRLAESDFTFTSPSLDLNISELAAGDLPAVRADLQLEQIVVRHWRAAAAEAGRWYALGHFNARTLRLPWLAQQASLDGSLQLSGSGLRGTAVLATAAPASSRGSGGTGAPATGGNARIATGATGATGATASVHVELLHRFDDGAGFADIELPAFRLSGESPLSSLLSLELPQGDMANGDINVERREPGNQPAGTAGPGATFGIDADMVAGDIAGAGSIEWNGGDIAGGFLLRLEDLSGFFAETAFLDLDADIELELAEDFSLRNAAPLEASIARVDLGLPLEDVRWNYAFDSASGILEIRQWQAAVLGGTISLPRLRLDRDQLRTRQPPPALNLVLSNVDLAEATSLAKQDDLTVTGRISGYLPVRLEPAGIRIEDGLIGALRPGGTIRYTPPQPASDPRMQTVYDFLSDYRFETLNSYVQLDATGDLRLQTEITGTNPTVNPDQPVNLNVNITDNIPELLRSLRASREISRLLEEQLNRR